MIDSLAVYCQESIKETNRPVGYGVIGAQGNFYHIER